MPRPRIIFAFILLTCTTLAAVADPGFQAWTLSFGETWTGNAYRAPYVAVTGSEGTPIDMVAGAGARLNLVDPFLFPAGALTVDPKLLLSVRRYLAYQNGRVVPAQTEASLGADENLLPGFGSARVLTITLTAPVALELALDERIALAFGISPTMLFRIRAGDADVLNDISDLNVMYSFFYGRLRWLRPEFDVAARFDLSDSFAFTIRTHTTISLLDLIDPTLPGWDHLQVGAALEFSLTPGSRDNQTP